MDLNAELAASKLSAAVEAIASIDAGWVVSDFKPCDSDELRRTYRLRLEHLRGSPGAHARQLVRSIEELIAGLHDVSSVEAGTLSSSDEHQFWIVRDTLGQRVIGVLRVVGKLDVSPARWEELWSQ